MLRLEAERKSALNEPAAHGNITFRQQGEHHCESLLDPTLFDFRQASKNERRFETHRVTNKHSPTWDYHIEI